MRNEEIRCSALFKTARSVSEVAQHLIRALLN